MERRFFKFTCVLFSLSLISLNSLSAATTELSFEHTLNPSNIYSGYNTVSRNYQYYVLSGNLGQQVSLLDDGDQIKINVAFANGESLKVMDTTAIDTRGTEMISWGIYGSGGWPDGWFPSQSAFFQFNNVSGNLSVNPITSCTSGGSYYGRLRWDYGTLHDHTGIVHSLTDSYYEIKGFTFVMESNGIFYNETSPFEVDSFQVTIRSDAIAIIPEPCTVLLFGLGGIMIRRSKIKK